MKITQTYFNKYNEYSLKIIDLINLLLKINDILDDRAHGFQLMLQKII